MKDNVVYGIHSARVLLEKSPERILELYILDTRQDKRIEEIIKLATQLDIHVQKQSKKQLDVLLPETNHQGVILRVKTAASLTENDLETLIEESTQPVLLLVLDNVQDPHNLGACLRTADAVGANAVIIPKDRAVSLTPVVRKIASGAAETVPLIEVSNLARALENLKKANVWLMGTASEATQSLYQTDLRGPVAIVLGAEGSGLRRLTAETCDVLMSIPMLGTVESLNVSVAAAVCLYEALRQRQKT